MSWSRDRLKTYFTGLGFGLESKGLGLGLEPLSWIIRDLRSLWTVQINCLVCLVFISPAHHSNYFTRERESTGSVSSSDTANIMSVRQIRKLVAMYIYQLWSSTCQVYLNAINEPAVVFLLMMSLIFVPRWSTYVCDLYLPQFSQYLQARHRSRECFSQSGLIIKPDRARMSDNLLETLEYLKCNCVFSSWEKTG